MDTARLVFDTARLDGMPSALANFIVAQARHETADFTSRVFKDCNNLFGYKHVGQDLSIRPCLSAPEGGYYASYRSISDSVHELTAWIKRRQAENKFPGDLSGITTATQYAQYLKAGGFYGDTVTNYTNGLVRFAVNFGGYASFAGLLVISLTFLYLNYRK